MSRVRIVTFATNDYSRSAHLCAKSAYRISLKDFRIHTPESVKSEVIKEFYREVIDIDFQTRGAGYWLWKPLLILMELDGLSEGDVLVYTDTRLLFMPNFLKQFTSTYDKRIKVLELCQDLNAIKNWTDPLVLKELGISEKIQELNMVLAGLIVIPKCDKNIEIVKDWLSWCMNPDYLSPDRQSEYSPSGDCIWHRHDQSLLSIIARSNMNYFKIIPYSASIGRLTKNPILLHRDLRFKSLPFVLILIYVRAFLRSLFNRLPRRLKRNFRLWRSRGMVSDIELQSHRNYFEQN